MHFSTLKITLYYGEVENLKICCVKLKNMKSFAGK